MLNTNFLGKTIQYHREAGSIGASPTFSRRATIFQSYGLSPKGRPIEDLDEVAVRMASCWGQIVSDKLIYIKNPTLDTGTTEKLLIHEISSIYSQEPPLPLHP